MIGVTGGTGFIGQRLVAQLNQQGTVRVLSRHPVANLMPNVERITGDISSPKSIANFVQGCSTIIHLAGIAHTDLLTTVEQARVRTVNYHGTRLLLQAALKSGTQRFIFVSTAHVYQANTACDIDEAMPIEATNYYAQTKIDAEGLVRDAGRQGLHTIIARPCLVYGPQARFNLDRMMRAIYRGYYFHVANTAPVRSFLSVENAARALQHLASPEIADGAYNLADEHPLSLIDFVNDLADRMQRPRPRSMPYSLFHYAGAIGSMLQRRGIKTSITTDALNKLIANATLSTCKLSQSGFKWDSDYGESRQQMVDFYLQSKCVKGLPYHG